jgi:hypothetical protein
MSDVVGEIFGDSLSGTHSSCIYVGKVDRFRIFYRLQANVSQHLAVLRAKQIVTNRKAGNQVFYSIRDPIIFEVLHLMRTYFYAHLKETMGMLDEIFVRRRNHAIKGAINYSETSRSRFGDDAA